MGLRAQRRDAILNGQRREAIYRAKRPARLEQNFASESTQRIAVMVSSLVQLSNCTIRVANPDLYKNHLLSKLSGSTVAAGI